MSRPVALGSELTSKNSNGWDHAGYSVAASADGTRIAYTVWEDDQGGTNAGAVRVFDWNGSAWTQVGSDILGSTGNSLKHIVMSDDGTRFFVSSVTNNFVKAYDYDTSSSSWTQVGSDITGSITFGDALACSADGSRIAVGNPQFGGSYTGEVKIYDWSGSAWTQVGSTLTGTTAGHYSPYFGISVALSANGNRLGVGSSNDFVSGLSSAGSVYVYDWSGSAWTQVGSKIEGTAGYDQEGNFLSMSDDGSRIATSANDYYNTPSYVGRIRVYDWSGSAWVQAGSDIEGLLANDFSTRPSLSGDGTRLAIGVYQGDYEDQSGTVTTDPGYLWVYDWSGSEWSLFDEPLYLSTTANGDRLGWSVALSNDGSTLVGGAPWDHVGGNNDVGTVKIWSVPAAKWKQHGNDLQLSLSGSGEEFGYQADISSDGSRVVVGAGRYSGMRGAVEMFQFNSSTSVWDSIGTIIGPQNYSDLFGETVAMSSDGSTIVVGARNYFNGFGYVAVYDYSGGTTWTQRGSTIYGSAQWRDFGSSVDISGDGDTIIIGEQAASTAYIYEWTGSAWSLDATLGGIGSSFFGCSVAMSRDGNHAAVGGYQSNSGAGHLRVFAKSGGSWSQRGSNINGTASNEYFGTSVALSSDGTRVLSGAYGAASSGSSNVGKVRVYDWNGSAWAQVGADIVGEQAEEYFGYAVGINDSGSRIAASGHLYDYAGIADVGRTKTFEYDASSSTWVQVGQNVLGETASERMNHRTVRFTVAGDYFVAGSFGFDSPSTNDGRARVFHMMKLPGFKYWDGSAFADSTAVQYWDGSAWTDVTGVKYWDGSAWADPS